MEIRLKEMNMKQIGASFPRSINFCIRNDMGIGREAAFANDI